MQPIFKNQSKIFIALFGAMVVFYIVHFWLVANNLPVFMWPDSKEYLWFGEKMGLRSIGFGELLNGRAFTLPLFYYLLGNQANIFVVQKILYMVSFIALAFACMSCTKSKWIQLALLIYILLLSYTKNFYFWHHSLLTECLNIVLFNFSIVLLIKLHHTNSKIKTTLVILYGLCTLLFFFSHLRDSNLYLLGCYFIAILLVTFKQFKKLRIHYAVIGILMVANYFFQQNLIVKSRRYQLPLLNVISMRILPNDNYSKWFRTKGLPNDSCVNAFTHKEAFQNYNDWYCFGEFRDKKGLQVYKEFLITHPNYTFWNLRKQFKPLLSGDISGYAKKTSPTHGFILTINSFYSFNHWWFWVSLVSLIFLLATRQIRPSSKLLLAYLLSSLSLLLILLVCFHGDAYEVIRHCMLAQYMYHFYAVFLLLMLPLFGKYMQQRVSSTDRSNTAIR